MCPLFAEVTSSSAGASARAGPAEVTAFGQLFHLYENWQVKKKAVFV